MIIQAIIGTVFLGAAYNMNYFSAIRVFIYDSEDIQSKLQVRPEESIVSKFQVINKAADLIDFLELDPALALREKYSSIGLPFQDVIRSVFDRREVIELVLYVKCKMENQTFPSDTKLKSDWQTRPQKYVGTHFVKSMTTGGNLVISYEITPSKPEYRNDVRNIIASHIGNSGIIDENLMQKLENFKKALDSKAYINLKTYSTGIGFHIPPRNIEEGFKFAHEFPQLLKNTGKGKGVVLEIELLDLHTVEPNYSEYKINPDLTPVLKEAYAKYDDILVSKLKLDNWESNYPISAREKQNVVNTFRRKLTLAKRAMTMAIIKLDVGGSTHQFDAAFEAYGEGEGNDKFKTEFEELIKN